MMLPAGATADDPAADAQIAARAALEVAGLDRDARAEALSANDFVRLGAELR